MCTRAGPWRVPGGLTDQVYYRARELAASDEARSLGIGLPDVYAPDATAVAAEFVVLVTFRLARTASCGARRRLRPYL